MEKTISLDLSRKYFFRYMLIDSFLSENDLEYFTKIFDYNSFSLPDLAMSVLYSYTISNKNDIKINDVKGFKVNPKEPILSLQLLEKHKRYKKLLDQILSILCPMKFHLIDEYDYRLVFTGKNCKYPIHDDVASKLLSTVVYLDPNENKGTILFPCPEYKLANGKSTFPNEGYSIRWKPNRALIFSRIKEKTWHSYEGNGIENRLSLVINVMTNRPEEAIKIEKSLEFKKTITWTS